MPSNLPPQKNTIIPADWRNSSLAHRPFVTLKAAITLDGKLAADNGDSRWISGETSRKHAHQLRAEHQAILVGRETIQQDNPQLSVRTSSASSQQPVCIVLDSYAQLAQQPQAWMKVDPTQQPPILAAGSQAPQKNLEALAKIGVRIWQDTQHPQPHIPHLLSWLHQLPLHSLLVEGGAHTHASFIRSNSADALALYLAPSLMGQPQAPAWCQALGITGMAHLPRLRFFLHQSMGEDLFLLARFLPYPQVQQPR